MPLDQTSCFLIFVLLRILKEEVVLFDEFILTHYFFFVNLYFEYFCNLFLFSVSFSLIYFVVILFTDQIYAFYIPNCTIYAILDI